MFNTPILFIIFNRPEASFKVFEQIRRIKPQKLFIAADGPRADNATDRERCLTTRKVADYVDWPCQLYTLFKDTNAGPFWGPVSAISWFFSEVEQGLILEDDCFPDLSFFDFCENLLNYYKDNSRIMHISGSNFQFGKTRGSSTYYFSKYTHVWGWASWRRAWQYYEDISKIRSYDKKDLFKYLESISSKRKEAAFWKRKFGAISDEQRNGIWDYQWNFTVWRNNGLAIVPNTNLISNIGFGQEASGTTDTNNKFANLPLGNINEVTHPPAIEINQEADAFIFFDSTYYFHPSFKDLLRWKIKSIIKN